MKKYILLILCILLSIQTKTLEIFKNIPLAEKNWFKTGGSAKFYCEPQTTTDIKLALNFANKNNLEVFILGQGAHVLISDDGFDGIVITPKMKRISHIFYESYVLVNAQAGATIFELIEYCMKNSIIGLEEFAYIPASVGGALCNNIKYFSKNIGDYVACSKILEKSTNKIINVEQKWFNSGYNTSKLKNENHILLDTTFKLKPGTKLECAYAKGRHDEIIRQRKSRYPTKRTCGFFFRNFTKKEVELTNNKTTNVIYYLSKLCIAGNLNICGAHVSHKHPNMLATKIGTNTNNIIDLAIEIQKMCYKKFGLIPQPECKLVGFKKYPLIK